MKRIILTVFGSLSTLAFLGLAAAYIWIDNDVKDNIRLAKEKYIGKADDALMAYLIDTTNSTRSRTSIAIWTLGQIQSEKALPLLTKLYRNDPEGRTCKGKHDSLLCQYEIHKALYAIKLIWWPMHARLNI